ncbi:MAG: hypothetical protein HRT69_12990 [Flavobacteriaceae bacterium]|nr:hypothetical protein [Flavobacteriaceae bacterium]
MEELDILKKNWNKDIHPKVSAESIYKMILKKSSSTVKWIFIISVIELGIGLITGVFITPQDYNDLNLPSWIEHFVTISSLLIVFIYSFKFYKNYKTINTSSSIKVLLNNIIKTRKTVKQFVLINLSLMAILIIIALSYTLTSPTGINNEIVFELINLKDYLVLGIIILISTAICIGICLFIYFLLYGILMRKLNKNYEELKQLDL